MPNGVISEKSGGVRTGYVDFPGRRPYAVPRIAIQDAEMDIDLYLQHGTPLDDYSYANQSATTEYYREKLS
jgi:hypothetical protein